jgi:hypothetical protein
MGLAAMGPFYCPADEKVYIDLDFYREPKDRFPPQAILLKLMSSPMKLVITCRSF